MPAVAIIVPCYNQAHCVLETLQSIAAQTFTDWECVVVDDGSTDQTGQVVQDWIRADARFRYLHQPNAGVAAARNAGIAATDSEFILPLDGDDVLYPDYLAAAMDWFAAHPETGLVSCHVRRFGTGTGIWRLPAYDYQRLLWCNSLFNSSVYRRSLFQRTSGYASNMVHGYEDWELYIRMLGPDTVVHRLDQPGYRYRVQAVSRSTEQLKHDRLAISHRQIVANNPDKYAAALQDPIGAVLAYADHASRETARKYRRQRRHAHLLWLLALLGVLVWHFTSV